MKNNNISSANFKQISETIYKYSSCVLLNKNIDYVNIKISNRISILNTNGHIINSIDDYIAYLTSGENSEYECEMLSNQLLINDTYFFRDYDQLAHLVGVSVPDILEKTRKEELVIWSAACSTGEEAYGLAMALKDSQLVDNVDIKIYASDINSDSINIAKSGVYYKMSFRDVPKHLYENHVTHHQGFTLSINDDIKKMISFSQGNLFDRSKEFAQSSVDIIICRNVLIYFSQSAKERASDEFYRILSSPGYIYLGRSEQLEKFSSSNITQKVSELRCYIAE